MTLSVGQRGTQAHLSAASRTNGRAPTAPQGVRRGARHGASAPRASLTHPGMHRAHAQRKQQSSRGVHRRGAACRRLMAAHPRLATERRCRWRHARAHLERLLGWLGASKQHAKRGAGAKGVQLSSGVHDGGGGPAAPHAVPTGSRSTTSIRQAAHTRTHVRRTSSAAACLAAPPAAAQRRRSGEHAAVRDAHARLRARRLHRAHHRHALQHLPEHHVLRAQRRRRRRVSAHAYCATAAAQVV